MLSDQFTNKEWKLLKSLNSPAKIQDYLNQLPTNFELSGDECKSPRRVMAEGNAHCMEGAMLAALALRVHGERPLLLDLSSRRDDDDHIVTLFKRHNCWGGISKTNHAVLRYREPVYRTIRELVMSYFHEYFLQKGGAKTLRCYATVDLSRFDKKGWMTSEENVWYVNEYLFALPHTYIIDQKQIRSLRRADPIEIKAGEILEWKSK